MCRPARLVGAGGAAQLVEVHLVCDAAAAARTVQAGHGRVPAEPLDSRRQLHGLQGDLHEEVLGLPRRRSEDAQLPGGSGSWFLSQELWPPRATIHSTLGAIEIMFRVRTN